MSVREQLGDHRPYWKVALSLFFSLSVTVILIYAGVKGLGFFAPFVVGWILSAIATPLVTFLEKRLRIVKKLGSAITIVLVLAACIGIIYLLGSKAAEEISTLVKNFPGMYRDLENSFREIGAKGTQLFEHFPEQVRSTWNAIMTNLGETIGDVIGQISEPTVTAAGNAAKRIPSVLVSTIVALVSSYFFIAEKEMLLAWMKKVVPYPIVSRMTMVSDNLKYAVGGYFKAQFKIMGVVFLILLGGFALLGFRFSILFAALIALLDFFPFFGTGTALLPWSLYKFLVGDYKVMFILLALYGITQLVRQLIQPKLVGDSMGLNPLYTLFLLYIGYRIGSVFGMILAVPAGLILLNLYKAGAFDYILDDVKVLAEDIMSLRNREDVQEQK